jgi:hypothetical protein
MNCQCVIVAPWLIFVIPIFANPYAYINYIRIDKKETVLGSLLAQCPLCSISGLTSD